MKSAIYLGKEKIEIREVPMPSIGDDDVLIKNVYSSICGTELRFINMVQILATVLKSAKNLVMKRLLLSQR